MAMFHITSLPLEVKSMNLLLLTYSHIMEVTTDVWLQMAVEVVFLTLLVLLSKVCLICCVIIRSVYVRVQIQM